MVTYDKKVLTKMDKLKIENKNVAFVVKEIPTN